MEQGNIDVKAVRAGLRLTQLEFAKRLGVDVRTVQKWEAGGTVPRTKREIIRGLSADPTPPITQTATTRGGSSVVQSGAGVSADNLARALEALRAAQELNSKTQEQVDRLIGLLEVAQRRADGKE